MSNIMTVFDHFKYHMNTEIAAQICSSGLHKLK